MYWLVVVCVVIEVKDLFVCVRGCEVRIRNFIFRNFFKYLVEFFIGLVDFLF